jgi:hypothetical protein
MSSTAHELLHRLAPSCCIATLCSAGVEAQVLEAIAREDTLRRRASPLSPAATFWLTLALPLHRSLSIEDVFARLVSQARGMAPLSRRAVTDGALAHARERLGPRPFRAFFDSLRELRPGPSFHGRRVAALDSVVLSLADTSVNREHFGRHRTRGGPSPFPQLRLATLTWTRTREIAAAAWTSVQESERGPCERIALESLQRGEIVLLDRGIASYGFCDRLAQRGIHYVARLRRSATPRVLRRRGAGDFDVEHATRLRNYADPGSMSPMLSARLISYRVEGGARVRLLTSLTDPSISPQEIAQLYHERWEVETCYDEIKVHLASVSHGSPHLPLRGRSPAMVEQELWATLCTYNLVRRLLALAARRKGIDPRRISFTSAVRRIQEGPGDLGRPFAALLQLLEDLAELALDRYRRTRRCPRACKAAYCGYPRKRPRQRCRSLAASPAIILR